MLDLHAKPDRPLVAPSILAADFGRLAEEAQDVMLKGADLLHLDVMDGHFVDNLTMGADIIQAMHHHLPRAFLDVHLMVDRPQDYVRAFADAGANHFSFHAEVSQPHRTHGVFAERMVEQIHEAGMTAGIVVNPHTPVEWVSPVLDQVEMVLIMSVQPGRGGQAFMPHVLDKVRQLRVMDFHKRIEIDGGIGPDTAPLAAAAGVDVMVAGSAIFKADDRAAAIAQIGAGAR